MNKIKLIGIIIILLFSLTVCSKPIIEENGSSSEGNNVTNEPSPMQSISMAAEELRKKAEKNPPFIGGGLEIFIIWQSCFWHVLRVA